MVSGLKDEEEEVERGEESQWENEGMRGKGKRGKGVTIVKENNKN